MDVPAAKDDAGVLYLGIPEHIHRAARCHRHIMVSVVHGGGISIRALLSHGSYPSHYQQTKSNYAPPSSALNPGTLALSENEKGIVPVIPGR